MDRLTNRISNYSALAAGTLLASGAGAQVVYTDVNPDVTINATGTSYVLDLNNDFTPDFNIILNYSSSTYSGGSTGGIIISAYNTNQVAFQTSYGLSSQYNVAIGFATNNLIESSTSWRQDALVAGFSVYGTASYFGGEWAGNGDLYLGLQLDVGGSVHYGWCRMNVAADGKSFIVKDYAYETTPDVPIYAGNTNSFTSIQGNPDGRLDIVAVDGGLFLKTSEQVEVESVQIHDLAGQLVLQEDAPAADQLIELSGLDTGIYVATAHTNVGSTNVKVYLRSHE